jgi:hypothetical protein
MEEQVFNAADDGSKQMSAVGGEDGRTGDERFQVNQPHM